jgi:hypothetical protein
MSSRVGQPIRNLPGSLLSSGVVAGKYSGQSSLSLPVIFPVHAVLPLLGFPSCDNDGFSMKLRFLTWSVSLPPRVVLVAVDLLAVTFFLLSYSTHGVGFGPYRIDLDVYRMGGQTWLHGGDLYGRLRATQARPRLPFTYPPIPVVAAVAGAGNNGWFDGVGGAACGYDYLCVAKHGYDAPTGLGTPNGTGSFWIALACHDDGASTLDLRDTASLELSPCVGDVVTAIAHLSLAQQLWRSPVVRKVALLGLFGLSTMRSQRV